MRLLLQVLKLCFWALPAQRLCTLAGLALMAVAGLWLAPQDLSNNVLLWATNGISIAFLPALVMGGPLWRSLASQRAVALAPHGRARLLFAAIAVAALCGMAMGTYFWALFLWLPTQWQRGLSGWWIDSEGAFALASVWAIASFLASRSLLATLTVLVVLLGGGIALVRLDLPPPKQWLPGGGPSFTVLCWILFATWYLGIRRIAPSAWTSRRAEDEAVVTQADTGGITTRISREVALQRLMLGGRSTGRIILQWLLALVLLQVILLFIRAAADVPASQVAPLQFLAVALVLPAMAALSWVVAARLRPLWLACGCSRAELFAVGEGTLLRLALGLAIVAAACFVMLSGSVAPESLQSSRLLLLGLGSVAGAVLLPAYAALLHRGVAALAALVVAVVTLEPTYMKAFVYGEPAGSCWWLAVLVVAIVALRELARRRWLGGDMPRGATSPAS